MIQRKTFILLTGLFAPVFEGSSQEIRTYAGVGVPDWFHVGVSYEISDKNEFGVQIGSALINGTGKTVTPGLEFRRYFGTSKKFQQAKTWFFGTRLIYLNSNQLGEIRRHDGFSTLTIGRNHHISRKSGISIDYGILLHVLEVEETNSASNRREDAPFIFPSLNIRFFRLF